MQAPIRFFMIMIQMDFLILFVVTSDILMVGPYRTTGCFKNTGTFNQATFKLIMIFANLSNLPLNTILNIPVAGVSPSFGDLDDDGDDDMILGDADGKLHFFENIAGRKHYPDELTH